MCLRAGSPEVRVGGLPVNQHTNPCGPTYHGTAPSGDGRRYRRVQSDGNPSNAATQHFLGSCGNLSADWAKIGSNRVKKPNLLAYFSGLPHISGFGSFLR
jgi:hypothetical protein